MLDLLSFLFDSLTHISDLSPRARHEGESLYWRLTGIILLPMVLGSMILWCLTDNAAAPVACIAFALWLLAHLAIRSTRNGNRRD